MDLKQALILMLSVCSQAQNECRITPVNTSCEDNVNDRGYNNGIETRLFIGIKFVCNGTIVGWRVAATVGSGSQYPKLQVWRPRNGTSSSEEYFKPGNDTSMEGTVSSAPVNCDIFEHSLDEGSQVSVQSGDILGIELPPGNDQALDILYALGDNGPPTYIYRYRLPSSITLRDSTILFGRFNVQPLIDLRVVTESQSTTVSEIPTLVTDSKIVTTMTKNIFLITTTVLGTTQFLIILTVMILTVALIHLNRKYKKANKEQPDFPLRSNSAYGVVNSQA